ncbi:3-oxoacyl-[acyl-carrier-protein] synthase III C-terminal domain-containing protein [Rhodococcus sp. NPDC060084]|uniref:3-oxoacyl-[acyl-carrier-protein] synthase III C-terminal domain-containing protein n=1 Tax=Rhodococcus sp. NPDC060084 TaxID=3347053 RepID=UPI003648573C
MLDRLGLASVPFVGVWLGESGNLVGAVRLARGLLRSGMRTVLIVVTDAVPQRHGEFRAMPNGVTVNGDGAAACLASTALGEGYVLEGIGHAATPGAAQAQRLTGLREYFRFMAGVRSALTQFSDVSGIRLDSYQWLVANNYSATTLDDFADTAMIPRDRVFRGTIARHGHVFTADGLINLADLHDGEAINPGDRVLVLSTGPFSWGVLGLRQIVK